MASIPNCPITKTNSEILKSWVADKDSYAYIDNGGYHTGIDLECKKVYSVCYGVVIELGMHDDGYYYVTVQYDKNKCVRYMHLKSESVLLGGVVAKEDEIGEANKYVHFEYMTVDKGSSIWGVRIDRRTYYKQNPTTIATYGLGDSAGMDLQNAYQSATVGHVSIDYTTIDKYLITINRNTSDNIDYTKIKELGVVGVMVEAGYLYDSYHNVLSYRNPKLDSQVKQLQEANLPFALYTYARGTTLEEVNRELERLQYCIRHYPPMLGVWLIPVFTKTVKTNNILLQRYETVLTEWGLKGKLGLYGTRAQVEVIDWKSFQNRWYLWLVDHCKDAAEITNEELISPEFFMYKVGD